MNSASFRHEPDDQHLRGLIKNRLTQGFSNVLKGNEELQHESVEKVLEIIRETEGHQDLLIVVDANRLDAFNDLDKQYLQAAISSSSEQSMPQNVIFEDDRKCSEN